MEKFRVTRVLKNQLGQSTVEYILLIAVITSIGYAFFHNKRFREFIAGKNGFFATMREGMSYSYRYSHQYDSSIDIDKKVNFNYETRDHDLYTVNSGESHFFTGIDKYPR